MLPDLSKVVGFPRLPSRFSVVLPGRNVRTPDLLRNGLSGAEFRPVSFLSLNMIYVHISFGRRALSFSHNRMRETARAGMHNHDIVPCQEF